MLLFSRVDSIMLVEEGFDVMSVDASDKMLKYALKSRWERRKEPAFDRWGEFFRFPHLPPSSTVWSGPSFSRFCPALSHRGGQLADVS